MSLTQERINEIALEVAHRTAKTYRHKAEEPYGFDEDCMIHAFNRFLSHIREEQEAVAEVKEGHLANWLQWNSEELMSITPIGTKLFTIPPAAPESACKELVEALEKIVNGYDADVEMGDDFPTILKRDVIEAKKAIAKHKASMGEKE